MLGVARSLTWRASRTESADDVNAVVTLESEAPRARAERPTLRSGRAPRGVVGKRHGCRSTIKDTFETAGIRTTVRVGENRRITGRRRSDAVAVERIKGGGRWCLGGATTNGPTLAATCRLQPDFGTTTQDPGSGEDAGGIVGRRGCCVARAHGGEIGSDSAGRSDAVGCVAVSSGTRETWGRITGTRVTFRPRTQQRDRGEVGPGVFGRPVAVTTTDLGLDVMVGPSAAAARRVAAHAAAGATRFCALLAWRSGLDDASARSTRRAGGASSRTGWRRIRAEGRLHRGPESRNVDLSRLVATIIQDALPDRPPNCRDEGIRELVAMAG